MGKTKKQYAEYLQSPHWKQFRQEHLKETPRCEKCSIPRWLAELIYDQDLHLHHLTYERLGEEAHSDVQVLCRRCHELETFGRSELRTLKPATCSLCRETHWDYRVDLCSTCDRVLDGLFLQKIMDCGIPWNPETKIRRWMAAQMCSDPYDRVRSVNEALLAMADAVREEMIFHGWTKAIEGKRSQNV